MVNDPEQKPIVDKRKQNRNLLLAIGAVLFAGILWTQQTAEHNPSATAPVQTSPGSTTDNVVTTPAPIATPAAVDPAPSSPPVADTSATDTSSPAQYFGEYAAGDAVSYEVHSSCPTNVTYVGDGGSIEQESNVEDGWTKDVTPGDFADVSAQLQCEGGDVTVSVLQGGSTVKTASSNGDYVIADAHAP